MNYTEIKLASSNGETLLNITIKNRIVISCDKLETLVGKIIINGHTCDNNSKTILIGEKLYFVDDMNASTYKTLRLSNGEEPVIKNVK
jgi:hypothetical protein